MSFPRLRPLLGVAALAFALACALQGGLPTGVAARGGAPRPVASAAKPKPKPKKKAPPLPLDERRAIASYTAMQSHYYVPLKRLYRGSPYSDLWPYSQAFSATVDMAALPNLHTHYRPDLTARLGGLQSYWAYGYDPPIGYLAAVGAPKRTTGVRYFDDNAWIGLDLIRLYRQDHLAELLPTAEKIFSLEISAWDGDSGVACPGGIPFTDLTVNGDRNTVTNAPAAELGAELYDITGQASDLVWAGKLYNWVRSCLLEPSGLYSDHIGGGGAVDATEWTYNQGSMIGAGAMLYQATHNPTFLAQAEVTARAATGVFTGAQLDTQPAAFNAIYLRNLLFLGTQMPASAGDSGGALSPPGTGTTNPYAAYVQAYADDMWDNVRDPASGLFLAEPGGNTQLLDSAAMAQVYAMLSEPFSGLF